MIEVDEIFNLAEALIGDAEYAATNPTTQVECWTPAHVIMRNKFMIDGLLLPLKQRDLSAEQRARMRGLVTRSVAVATLVKTDTQFRRN